MNNTTLTKSEAMMIEMALTFCANSHIYSEDGYKKVEVMIQKMHELQLQESLSEGENN